MWKASNSVEIEKVTIWSLGDAKSQMFQKDFGIVSFAEYKSERDLLR